jgi:hypothetical protein
MSWTVLTIGCLECVGKYGDEVEYLAVEVYDDEAEALKAHHPGEWHERTEGPGWVAVHRPAGPPEWIVFAIPGALEAT